MTKGEVTVLLKNEALKLLHYAERELKVILYFLSKRYTWLSVLVFGILGFILIWIFCYINRYSHYDWWKWKGRAVRKIILFIFTLTAAKMLLQGVLQGGLR